MGEAERSHVHRNYITNFGNYFVPFPNWHIIAANIAYFKAHGVAGVFEEGTYGTPGGDLVQLKDYVISRALWNVSYAADGGEALIDEFVTGYYGGAAPHVREYMKAMEASVQATSFYMHESFHVDAAFLTPSAVLRAAAALNSATAAATGRFAPRAAAASMPPMYVALWRWDELRAYAANVSAAWPYASTKRAQFDAFKALYQANNVSQLNEPGKNITWLEAQLFPPRGAPPLVEAEAGRPRLHW